MVNEQPQHIRTRINDHLHLAIFTETRTHTHECSQTHTQEKPLALNINQGDSDISFKICIFCTKMIIQDTEWTMDKQKLFFLHRSVLVLGIRSSAYRPLHNEILTNQILPFSWQLKRLFVAEFRNAELRNSRSKTTCILCSRARSVVRQSHKKHIHSNKRFQTRIGSDTDIQYHNSRVFS